MSKAKRRQSIRHRLIRYFHRAPRCPSVLWFSCSNGYRNPSLPSDSLYRLFPQAACRRCIPAVSRDAAGRRELNLELGSDNWTWIDFDSEIRFKLSEAKPHAES